MTRLHSSAASAKISCLFKLSTYNRTAYYVLVSAVKLAHGRFKLRFVELCGNARVRWMLRAFCVSQRAGCHATREEEEGQEEK